MSQKSVYIKIIFNQEIEDFFRELIPIKSKKIINDGDIFPVDITKHDTPDNREMLKAYLPLLKNWTNGK